ncbi:HD-GYP domain-containing protein [Peribacillus faecalis]|uniref:HD-GYP domain-containing protein n=1 Tax=Peribacillus faecalis TaxID=2772559 RepID=UPI001F3F7823|nr:HD-GYP domain-containing protein [Peribacillus faecalis]
MLVKTTSIVEGCVLAKDIFSKTSKPIMSKKTVLTNELKQILQAFLINEVSVERKLENGDIFAPKEVIQVEEVVAAVPETGFMSIYLEAIQHFKRLFNSWQAGFPVDLAEIRKIFVPLLELALENIQDVFSTYQYSTKNEYFYHHLVSVGLISGVLGKELGLSKGDIVQVALAGCLSDIGMAKIPQRILDRNSALTFEEYSEIKRHPSLGYQLIKDSTTLKKAAKLAIIQHHERLDGSGYPSGERGNNIHLFSRIVTLADVFHAMASERLYRGRQSPYRVIETLMHDGFGKFDIKVLNTLISKVVQISIGSTVQLSDDRKGTVVFINNRYPTRPVVHLEDGSLVDLDRSRELFIIDA